MSEGEADDVVLKLLHTADWHLGHRFAGFEDAERLKLTRARLEVIDRIVDLADHNSVDAVLCAGDLFDEPCPAREWYEGLARALSRSRRRPPTFLLPGNHDPLTRESPWVPGHAFRQLLPPWVHVVDRDDFSFELAPDAVLYAAPCRSRAGGPDLAMMLPAREAGDERIRIGLVHGSTFDLEGHQMNFPIARDAATLRGLDYLAIGDTHSFKDVQPEAPVPTIYPGAPESTSFGEDGSGQVAIVLVPRRGRRAQVRAQRVARWRWRAVSCRDLASVRALRDSEDLSSCVIRLVLDMRVTIPESRTLDDLLAELKGTESAEGRIGILQVDRTRLVVAPELDLDALGSNLPETLQLTVRQLKQQSAQSGPQAETATRALRHLYDLLHERRA